MKSSRILPFLLLLTAGSSHAQIGGDVYTNFSAWAMLDADTDTLTLSTEGAYCTEWAFGVPAGCDLEIGHLSIDEYGVASLTTETGTVSGADLAAELGLIPAPAIPAEAWEGDETLAAPPPFPGPVTTTTCGLPYTIQTGQTCTDCVDTTRTAAYSHSCATFAAADFSTCLNTNSVRTCGNRFIQTLQRSTTATPPGCRLSDRVSRRNRRNCSAPPPPNGGGGSPQ